MIITKQKTIYDVQEDFAHQYPFLKLEFYELDNNSPASRGKKPLSYSTSLKAAGLSEDNGIIEICNEMTVAELEKTFRKKFGLDVQVSRKSGMIWLETKMTDKWSLQKQNQHGREISLTSTEYRPVEIIQGNG